MTEYITQEQSELLAKKHAREVYKSEGVYDAMTVPLAALPALCNAAIQHYKDSQPKPASVEVMTWNQMSQSADFLNGLPMRHVPAAALMTIEIKELRRAITQQAEALAQALAENSNLNSELTAALKNWGHMQQDRDECKEATILANQRFKTAEAKLATLQYDGELPPLPESSWSTSTSFDYWNKNAMQDYARQAIANDRAKWVLQLPEHATPQMQIAGAGVKIDMTGVDAEPGTVGWLTAARVWMVMHRAALAAAPSPKEGLKIPYESIT
jgi:hypothetical protein